MNKTFLCIFNYLLVVLMKLFIIRNLSIHRINDISALKKLCFLLLIILLMMISLYGIKRFGKLSKKSE